jgi:uncharacterized membrane protein
MLSEDQLSRAVEQYAEVAGDEARIRQLTQALHDYEADVITNTAGRMWMMMVVVVMVVMRVMMVMMMMMMMMTMMTVCAVLLELCGQLSGQAAAPTMMPK